MKILMVEHPEQGDRELYAKLSSDGHELQTVHSAEAALVQAQIETPAVVISEVDLPQSDGLALCQRWLSDNELQGIPFLFYTSTESTAHRLQAEQLGATGYLQKPIDRSVLLHALKMLKQTAPVVTPEELSTTDELPLDELLRRLARAAQLRTSERFFEEMAQELSELLQADGVSIGELVQPECKSMQTLGVFINGGLQENIEYALEGTPCANVLGHSICVYPSGVIELFPDDLFLQELGIEGYVGIPLWDSGGQPLGVIATLYRSPIRDSSIKKVILKIISERVCSQIEYRREHQAREATERRMALAIQGADLGTWDWDVQAGTGSCNERWAAMLGYTLEELDYQVDTWRDLIHPDDFPGAIAALDAHLAGRTDDYESEYRMRHRSGDWIWVLDKGGVIDRDENGAPLRVCGTHLDITQRKLDEAERQNLEVQLRHSQKMEAIGQLAGGLAHDFNNILTAIMGNVDLHQDVVNSELGHDHRIAHAMEQIRMATQRASLLTRKLLTFSRRDVIRPELLDLNKVLMDLHPMLQRLLTAPVAFEVNTEQELPAIQMDVGQLEQVIVNLVVNAVQAMPVGGALKLRTGLVHLGEDDVRSTGQGKIGSYALLSVEDTGHGIPTEIRERIFEPFFTTKGPEVGTGLGLATVHGIVRQAGGHITVESEPDNGTTFHVHFPTSMERSTTKGQHGDDTAPAGGSEVLLVCEDDEEVRMLTMNSLQKAGYEVYGAGTGAAALAIAASDRVDMLLADVIMPDMNGREISDQIRSLRPGLPTLFMSGYTSNIISQHGIDDESSDFLQKPFTRARLLEKVRLVLNKKLV